MTILVQKNIVQLEISIDNSMIMEKENSDRNLSSIEPCWPIFDLETYNVLTHQQIPLLLAKRCWFNVKHSKAGLQTILKTQCPICLDYRVRRYSKAGFGQ